ncbi:MAG: hypothetical protein ACXVBE_16525, partial [Bdellovibrionota bacterium]
MKNILIGFMGLVLSASAFAGGVSGGGGNSKPANPVSRDDVKRSIMEARKYAAAYFNHLEMVKDDESRWPGQKELPAKLFNGPDQAVDWVLRLPISINENGPCLDPAGQPMDGSASLNPPAVCLSLPRLSEKLSKEGLRVQVIALVLHEYSHLVGATEAEADFLQTAALDNLLRADFNGIDRILERAWNSIIYLQEFAGGGDAAPPESIGVWEDLHGTLGAFIEDFQRTLWGSPSVDFFMPWSSRMREYFMQTYPRLLLMDRAACAYARGEEAESCWLALNTVFQNDQEIDYHT